MGGLLMCMKKVKKWYEYRGKMYLIKNSKYIREYSYQNTSDRKRMTRIWMSEITKTEDNFYELIYSPQI